MTGHFRNWVDLIRKGALGALMAVVAVIATGCGGRIVSGPIEKGIREKLPELIGPAKSYQVNVDGSASKMMHGKIKKIDIRGVDVKVSPGLVVSDLHVVLSDVVADTKSGDLKSVGATVFDATVTEDSLNRFLAETREDKMRAQMLDGRMVVVAEPSVLGLAVSVRVTGRLVPNGSVLNYKVDQLKVVGIKTPSLAVRMVEDEVNPVIDLATPQFAPLIETVEIKPGVVRIVGTAALGK